MKIKNKYFVEVLIFVAINLFCASAQTGTGLAYNFRTGLVTLPPNLSFNVVFANRDESISNVIVPLGYPGFTFSGIFYSGFYVSSNGWMGLTNLSSGSVAPLGPLPLNSLSTQSGPIIAPLWDNLQSTVLYAWDASTGNLWVRWALVSWQTGSGSNTFTVYACLNPSSGYIGFVWPPFSYTPLFPSASMGISGICQGDFYSITPNLPATIDSVVENGSVSIKPVNLNYEFTPRVPLNDDCSGAISLGMLSTNCNQLTFSTVNATAFGGSLNCSPGGTDSKDVFFTVEKPAGCTSVRIQTSDPLCSNMVTGTSIEVDTGNCASLIPIGCSSSNGISNYASIDIPNLSCGSQTLYIRVTTDDNSEGKFNICTQDISHPNGLTCENATEICSLLPYNGLGLTTAGKGNDYDSISSVCHSEYLNGQDYVFSYTPLASECVQISIGGTGINSNPAIFLFDGCPDDSINTHCIAEASALSDSVFIGSVSLKASTTYYIVIDNKSTGGFIPFNFHFSELSIAKPVNDVCDAATDLGIIFSSQTCDYGMNYYTTECATPSDDSELNNNPLCGEFENGRSGNVWLKFTAGFSGQVDINTVSYSLNPMRDGAMAVYSGSCGHFTLLACDDNSGAEQTMPKIIIPVTNNQTYYIMVWSSGRSVQGAFQICIAPYCLPPNDSPCNAILLQLGVNVLGDNTCASFSSDDEPPVTTLGCGSHGNINSVWYKVVVPFSGQLKIRASSLTLNDTQIYTYLFPGGCVSASTNYVLKGCNDDAPFCDMSVSYDSEILMASPLISPGDTVYILVDGYANYTGTFNIVANDFFVPYPPVTGKDCMAPISILSNADLVIVNNPGIHGIGNICDFNTTACSSGVAERGSTWFQFSVVNGSELGFTITPNDSSSNSPSANYDFILFDITGQTLNSTCDVISSLSPIRCNFSSTPGKTGCRHPSQDTFSDTLGPLSGKHDYLLCVLYRNELFNTTGYVLNWDIISDGSSDRVTQIFGECNTTSTVDIAICYGQSYTPPGGSAESASGIYVTRISNASGCDSIIITNLSVRPLPIAIISSSISTSICAGDSITLSSGIAFTYNWSNGATTQSIVTRLAGSYSVTVTDEFSCSSTSTPLTVTIDDKCPVVLNLKVIIEGFYIGGGVMKAILFPVDKPNVTDSITIELHNATEPNIFEYSCTSILDIYGNGIFVFPNQVFGRSYFIVLKHRNSLETWCKYPVLFNSFNVNFDLTKQ